MIQVGKRGGIALLCSTSNPKKRRKFFDGQPPPPGPPNQHWDLNHACLIVGHIGTQCGGLKKNWSCLSDSPWAKMHFWPKGHRQGYPSKGIQKNIGISNQSLWTRTCDYFIVKFVRLGTRWFCLKIKADFLWISFLMFEMEKNKKINVFIGRWESEREEEKQLPVQWLSRFRYCQLSERVSDHTEGELMGKKWFA